MLVIFFNLYITKFIIIFYVLGFLNNETTRDKQILLAMCILILPSVEGA